MLRRFAGLIDTLYGPHLGVVGTGEVTKYPCTTSPTHVGLIEMSPPGATPDIIPNPPLLSILDVIASTDKNSWVTALTPGLLPPAKLWTGNGQGYKNRHYIS